MSSIARLVAGAGLCIAAALAGCKHIGSRPESYAPQQRTGPAHPPQARVSPRSNTPPESSRVAAASYDQSALDSAATESDSTLPELGGTNTLRLPTRYDDRQSRGLCTKPT